MSTVRLSQKLCWLAAMLLMSLVLLAWIPWDSTAKPESSPTGGPASAGKPPLKRGVRHPATAFAPFLDIVPGQDGTELYISAGGVGELEGTVFVNIGIGPGHDKRSWTMAYSDTVRSYIATATGFTPGMDDYGPMSITTTQGLNTGIVDFKRAYVPASTIQTIQSVDGNLELALVSTDTIAFDTYIVVVPGYAPPGSPPVGHRLIGASYSVRAAAALTTTNRPMSLRMYYSDATLAGADPHALAIFAWDAFNRRWCSLGGRLFYDQHYLSAVTSRFTTYALMAVPLWRDDFDDFSGLGEFHNVTLGLQEGHPELLILSPAATTGTAVSRPITPTGGIATWGSLVFTATADPPTTTLTLDVLSPDGSAVLTDVVSGASLASLDPAQYPALKLRVNLSSAVVGETPALDEWRLTWEVEEHRVYLPAVWR